MTTQTVYTKDQAKAHDRLVAAQAEKLYRAQAATTAAWEEGHRIVGDKRGRGRGGERGPWQLARYQVRAELNRRGHHGAIATIGKAIERQEAEYAELDRLEQIWLSHGAWQRFYIVPGGHIHASRSCHTLRATTRLGWLPDLSGETEEDAVVAHGPLLCSVCFPSAPVEWTLGVQAPDDQCPGSKTADYPRETARMGYYSGNYGVCSHCGERVTLTASNLLRKHKKAAK
jgi:hypothetical protein